MSTNVCPEARERVSVCGTVGGANNVLKHGFRWDSDLARNMRAGSLCVSAVTAVTSLARQEPLLCVPLPGHARVHYTGNMG